MNFVEFKTAAADYFTPSELVELLEISTAELIDILESNSEVFDEQTVDDLKEIMGVSDDE